MNTGDKSHQWASQYICNYCSKTFSKQIHILRHTLIHTGQKPYQCSQCDKSFSQYANLKTYIDTQTNEKIYIYVVTVITFSYELVISKNTSKLILGKNHITVLNVM